MPLTGNNEHSNINPWLIAIAVMSSTFMEVLDTTVVNVSLPHIAGSLSASNDEATWTLTSYLVANAIILPMTGWLAGRFGRKRLLMTSVTGFTIASFLCGLAPNLPFLIACRVIQGRVRRRPTAALASHPAGVVSHGEAWTGDGILGAGYCRCAHARPGCRRLAYRQLQLALGLLHQHPNRHHRHHPDADFHLGPAIPASPRKKGIDFWGIGLLVVGIGSLQVMLDKGQEDDWFGSHFIVILTVLAVVGIAGLIIRELTAEHPILDLTVFKFRSYAIGTFLMTVIGFVLYGSTVLLPLFMQVLLGYTATHAGVTNLPRGLASFLIMPIVGRLTGKFDNRKLLGIGLVASAYAMWSLSQFSLDVSSRSFWIPLMIQGASLGFVFVPLTTITNNPIPNERMGNATSIFNLMRNIGASIGISMVETVQFRKEQVHINYLGANMNAQSSGVQNMLASMKAYFMSQGSSAATATQQAYESMWGMVLRQAAMLSYNDTFLFLAMMFVLMIPLLFLLRKPKAGKGPAMMH